MKHPENWFKSLGHALNGLRTASAERNFRFHIIATIGVLTSCYLLKLTSVEWICILSAITLVLITELINTAIERFCDLITKDYSLTIKQIKDITAGSVLISSIYALLVAILIIIPKLYLYF
jgi:diacylglycerol kinase